MLLKNISLSEKSKYIYIILKENYKKGVINRYFKVKCEKCSELQKKEYKNIKDIENLNTCPFCNTKINPGNVNIIFQSKNEITYEEYNYILKKIAPKLKKIKIKNKETINKQVFSMINTFG